MKKNGFFHWLVNVGGMLLAATYVIAGTKIFLGFTPQMQLVALRWLVAGLLLVGLAFSRLRHQRMGLYKGFWEQKLLQIFIVNFVLLTLTLWMFDL